MSLPIVQLLKVYWKYWTIFLRETPWQFIFLLSLNHRNVEAYDISASDYPYQVQFLCHQRGVTTRILSSQNILGPTRARVSVPVFIKLHVNCSSKFKHTLSPAGFARFADLPRSSDLCNSLSDHTCLLTFQISSTCKYLGRIACLRNNVWMFKRTISLDEQHVDV